MNVAYMIYQAERQPSVAERRAADAHRGELARALAQLVHRGQSGETDVRRGRPRGRARRHQAAPETGAGRRDIRPELAGC